MEGNSNKTFLEALKANNKYKKRRKGAFYSLAATSQPQKKTCLYDYSYTCREKLVEKRA